MEILAFHYRPVCYSKVSSHIGKVLTIFGVSGVFCMLGVIPPDSLPLGILDHVYIVRW